MATTDDRRASPNESSHRDTPLFKRALLRRRGDNSLLYKISSKEGYNLDSSSLNEIGREKEEEEERMQRVVNKPTTVSKLLTQCMNNGEQQPLRQTSSVKISPTYSYTSATLLSTAPGSAPSPLIRTFLSRSSSMPYIRTPSMFLERAAKKGGGGGKDKGKEEIPYANIKQVDLSTMKQRCEATMDFVKRQFGDIRVGRAGPELLERITVETPNGNMQIQHMAMITIKDALTLHITPYDPNMLKNIEKALQKSDLGLNPTAVGTLIRISLPKPTQDLRNKLLKNVNTISEEAKVSVRRHRKETTDSVVKQFRLTKDDEKTIEKNIQKMTDDFIAQVTKATESKVKEINS
ncbi:hypothetical protein DFA_04605 [Cavenderia fasciculata]|uniref:Ribosome recycling factor domain-containing protein n=1 Tax=Cavenderia fasciculata TaxID=261658 RepID=F4PQ14_CACFS|nr:uncharacterized protein DFA_04605 [Cavenderia fasciculata]EGG22477.1 hypothetical protein DFA_04605 [Cavenderia fasciculata]|eukprot:XP_004360328.1 hypothetical protein DFA_04605 [Cavenderia fasciculata]